MNRNENEIRFVLNEISVRNVVIEKFLTGQGAVV